MKDRRAMASRLEPEEEQKGPGSRREAQREREKAQPAEQGLQDRLQDREKKDDQEAGHSNRKKEKDREWEREGWRKKKIALGYRRERGGLENRDREVGRERRRPKMVMG